MLEGSNRFVSMSESSMFEGSFSYFISLSLTIFLFLKSEIQILVPSYYENKI